MSLKPFKHVFEFSLTLVIFFLINNNALAQAKVGDGYVVRTTVNEGDTIPLIYLRTYTVAPPIVFKNNSEKKTYDRLTRNVVKVYPYAKLGGDLLKEYDKQLANAKTDKEKKVFYKKIEQELKVEFEGDLRQMTVSQGRILIRLIDRETGQTSYDLVAEMRGMMSAFFWQSLAKMFGHNLRSEYGSEREDEFIEDIVIKIENGEIPVKKRKSKTQKSST